MALGGAIVCTGAAAAQDFIVLNSTDQAFAKGVELRSGQRVNLSPGKTMTLISVSGEVRTLTGGTLGAVIPKATTATPQPSAIAALRAMVLRPPPRRVVGAMRGMGNCPKLEELKTMDTIVAAETRGCTTVAKAALEAYLLNTAAVPVTAEEAAAAAAAPVAASVAPAPAVPPVPAVAPTPPAQNNGSMNSTDRGRSMKKTTTN
jgi:hypothetical protein